MAKVSENKIPNLNADWGNDETNNLPYSGKAVQDFIKKYCKIAEENSDIKVGETYFDTANMKFYTFRTIEDKEAFIQDGDISLVLSVQDIVFYGKQQKLSIINKMDSNNLYFTVNSKKAEITVGFESKEKEFNAQEWTDVIEDAYFTVSVDKGVTGDYVKILDNVLVRHGDTFTFDIFDYISSGSNRVKVTAVGLVSEQIANYGYNITLTSMYLSPAKFGWYLPFIEGNTYNLGGVNIGGALQKKLIIKVTNDSGYSEEYEENIGTAVYVTNPYYYTKLPFPSAGTGVYSIELYLSAEGVESEHLKYNIMCVSSSDQSTAKLCCITEIAEEVINYQDNTLFEYSCYNGGSTLANPHITLTANVGSDEPLTIVDEDLIGIETEKAIQYKYNIEIETEASEVTLNSVLTNGNTQEASFPVDNSASFPATAQAVFYVNPAIRNNGQENKETIINEINKENISAEWTNMSWVDGTDGWTVDDDGRKCLYLPARTKAVLEYKPLSSIGTGKTIEFNFKVSNASDYEESIITICDNPTDPRFRGINIRPNNILVHSRDLNTDDENQSYDILEDELVNVCISIIRNYKTNYGNICIIYVNGVRKKEFAFTNADSWITDGKIIIGSETADLSLYGIRVYDKGFGTQDALQNYVASLPNSIDKKKAYDLMHSVIDDSFNVDFEKTKAVANVVTIEMLDGGEIPHYGLSKEYTAQCNLQVMWNKNPEWNWGIQNMTIEGQGTTSMNYFRWNLRWRLDKTEGFTVTFPDGSTSTEDTLWFDGEGNHPKLARMTAKTNFASSMHSHKIGAVAMFNDIHHHLGLDNEVAARVAVYQHPFYFFEKKKIEGTEDQYTYSFIGLFTFGSDKGDKYTFGYKDPSVKDTLLVLEGLDHPIKGTGMDYPWSELVYVEDEESLCTDKGGNNYDAAWEVSQSGSAETVEEIQAKLDQEFKPAYEVAYNNSTMIIGTNESIDTINADVDAWGLRKDEYGNAYQRFEFWIDGEYELYFLSKKTNQYVKNGINLLTQLGLSSEDLSGLDIKAKNELFKQKRREKFKAEMGNYWHLDDTLYHYCLMLLIGATDNFKKNTYPYKLGTLASGSRWRWRQDDLDTLFDIDNQGLAVKGYSIETHDWTDSSKTAYVFKGEDSVFWTLISECYDAEEKAMGKRILGAMYEMSKSGTTTIDKLMGFMQEYFWNNAQDYFTKSAYNSDAEYKYEEAFPKYVSGEYDVDVHPLSQSLGDHLEAEKAWVRRRLIYMMSKWGYGPFEQYTDTCLGRINFRTQLAQSFTITPFMDLYPAILSGQGAVHSSPERVYAGEEVTITGAGGTNTNVYIMAADELESIGDLSGLTVDAASNAAISIASKRLKTIKVGDEVAEKVTSNLQQLSIGQCNSLESIDARNLKSLTGVLDLTRCPRLEEVYLAGTDLRSVTFANGSKIKRIQLPESITVLELLNLGKLEVLEKENLDKVEFLRIENCPVLDSFSMLRDIYNQEGSVLRDIRIIGFNTTGTSDDLDMLANIANDLDKDGQAHEYNGIDSAGVPQTNLLPVIEGSITVDGNVYEDSLDTVKEYFPNLDITVTGNPYFRFKDPEVQRIMATNWGDGTGITLEQVEGITRLNSKFARNKVIETFDEFEKFTGMTVLTGSSGHSESFFTDCSNLSSIKLPQTMVELASGNYSYGSGNAAFLRCTSIKSIDLKNIEIIGSSSFYGCSTLEEVSGNNIKVIKSAAFAKCPLLKTINLENVETLEGATFIGNKGLVSINMPNLLGTLGSNTFYSSNIEEVISLGNITGIGNGQGGYYEDFGAFFGCKNLINVILPESLVSIGNYAFSGCTSLTTINLPNNLEVIGNYAFNGCTNLTQLNLPQSIKSIGVGVFQNSMQAVPEEINLPNLETLEGTFRGSTSIQRVISLGNITSIPTNGFNKCTSLTTVVFPENLNSLGNDVFYECSNLSGDINLPNLETIGIRAFNGTGITSVSNLGRITSIPNGTSSYSAFSNCPNLESVNLPETLTSIGVASFLNCPSLRTINLNENIINIGYNAFNNCTSLTGEINLPNLEELGYTAFNNTKITKVLNLGKITKIESVKNNSSFSTFGRCQLLTEIILPDTITTIGQYSFADCTSLSKVKISNSLIYLREGAFANTIIKIIDLPSTLNKIDWAPFSGCSSLKIVILRAVVPPTLDRMLGGTYLEKIYVPDNSVKAYKTATNWSNYTDRIHPLSEYVPGEEDLE